MRNNIVRRAAAVATAAGIAVLGASSLPSTATAAPAGSQTPAVAPESAPTSTEHQAGVVIEGFTTINGQEVFLTVYDNSLHGSSANVVIGDPEDGGAFGFVEQATAFVVDGQLSITFDVDGKAATLSGTVVENGKPTRIRDAMQDGGENLVTKGTNTPLLANLTLAYDGQTVPVEVGAAFGYDLEVRSTDLYGN
ncbi:MAG TPA: hypothetical protein VFK41_11925 [Nocardioidaceae bacterium]|nr:hypothetical protein [Nocardioidaceae bacterium]